jgi:hypothetical protein
MPCPGSGGNNQTWTSTPVTVTPNSGISTLTVGYQLTAGNKPAGASGGTGGTSPTCTSAKPCTGTIGTQRINSGAYDSATATTSLSGGVLGANITDASNGSEITSIARGATKNVAITVSVLGFTDSTTIPSAPIELSFGGNQQNGALSCNGSQGGPQLQATIAGGCSTVYQTTTGTCPNSDNPPSCVQENPGNGKLDKVLDPGMNQRINGSANSNTCTSPNHWASPNTVRQVVAQDPPDPRLIVLIVTDYGALANGANGVPVRGFGEFYVTGWAGDPCITQANGISANGLAYTHDDDPGSANTGVLLGHFVKFVSDSGNGTGSGSCSPTSLNQCIAILTR